MSAELIQKRLNIILELAPWATTIGLLVNPNNNIEFATQVREIQEATRARGLSLYVARASNDRELDETFAAMTQAGIAVLVEGNDTLFLDRRKQIVAADDQPQNSHDLL